MRLSVLMHDSKLIERLHAAAHGLLVWPVTFLRYL